MGVAFAFARPLCGFDGGPHPLLSAFASLFGRPRMRIDADGDRVGLVTVERDCPCGAGRFVAKVLPGTRLSEAADTARCGTTITRAWRRWRSTRNCPTR